MKPFPNERLCVCVCVCPRARVCRRKPIRRMSSTAEVLEKLFMKIHLTSLCILPARCCRCSAPFNIHLSNFSFAADLSYTFLYARCHFCDSCHTKYNVINFYLPLHAIMERVQRLVLHILVCCAHYTRPWLGRMRKWDGAGRAVRNRIRSNWI